VNFASFFQKTGDEEPCHIIAFNEVRDSCLDVAPEVQAVEAEVGWVGWVGWVGC